MNTKLTPQDHDTHPEAADDRKPSRRLVAGGLAALAALAATGVLRYRTNRGGTTPPTTGFDLDLSQHLITDTDLIAYEQVGTLPIELERGKAITTGPDDLIYVLGDQAIHVLNFDGTRQEVIHLVGAPPLSFAVAPMDHKTPARLYVATVNGIDVLDSDRQVVAHWPLPDERTLFTSIVAAAADVFAADAGSRVIWRYSPSGEVRGQIGVRDPARDIPGFIIPSPYFDIVLGAEGLLYAVNPGKFQISAFTFDGDLGSSWGRGSPLMSDFFGCCNPAHIATLSDGRFVTSEKGIPRIKVYSATGRFESFVAGSEQLGIDERSVGDPRPVISERVFDIAVDRHDRILTLDSKHHCVRIFTAIDR